MPLLYRGQTAQYVIRVACVAFILAGIFGVIHLATVGPNGEIGSCPFLSGTVICNANTLDHMSAYQRTFAATPDILSVLLLLLLALAVARIVRWLRFEFAPPTSEAIYFPHKYLFVLSPLQEAFSRGILNTKVY